MIDNICFYIYMFMDHAVYWIIVLWNISIQFTPVHDLYINFYLVRSIK